MITDRLDAIIKPTRNEIRLAQEQVLEKIEQVLNKAETEVARKSRFMTTEQRLQTAEKELEMAEEHLLSALSSIYKALCYAVPKINPFASIQLIKNIEGITLVEEATKVKSRNFLSWKKT